MILFFKFVREIGDTKLVVGYRWYIFFLSIFFLFQFNSRDSARLSASPFARNNCFLFYLEGLGKMQVRCLKESCVLAGKNLVFGGTKNSGRDKIIEMVIVQKVIMEDGICLYVRLYYFSSQKYCFDGDILDF